MPLKNFWMRSSRHNLEKTDPSQFAPGQRWISETQAELGLALIVSCNNAQVQALFPATGETITYAARSAPLRRVAFEQGDNIKDNDGKAFTVASVREEEQRLTYIDADGNELESQMNQRSGHCVSLLCETFTKAAAVMFAASLAREYH